MGVCVCEGMRKCPKRKLIYQLTGNHTKYLIAKQHTSKTQFTQGHEKSLKENTHLGDVPGDVADGVGSAVPVLIAEAGALPGVAVPAVAAAAHRGVVEIHIVFLVVGRLVALVADHAGLVLCVGEKE